MQTSYPSDASFNLVDYNKSISDISSSNHSLHSVIGRFLAADEASGGEMDSYGPAHKTIQLGSMTCMVY